MSEIFLMNKIHKILAIDPGTDYIGVAYLYNEKFIAKTITSDYYGIKRLEDLVNRLVNIIEIVKPKFIGIEDYGYGGKFFNVEVAEIVGAIKYKLRSSKKKYEITFLAPNSVKLLVAGNGRATKPELRKAINKKYSRLKIHTSHESDAMAIFAVMEDYLKGKINADASRRIKGRTYSNI